MTVAPLTATRSERSEPASPVVKWVGGKSRLLPELLRRVPPHVRYFEPFAGGAALFFALRPDRAVLGDSNRDLIETYRAIRDGVEGVIAWLAHHSGRHSAAHYYDVRSEWNHGPLHSQSRLERAAMFLYLNRACFNGVWRVNKRGLHNVPFGKAAEVRFDVDNLRAASRALAGVELRVGSYGETVVDAQPGDLVYFDPPYDKTFNGYTSAGTFDQVPLAMLVRELAERGVHVMLSNSDTPLVRELYAEYRIDTVQCSRAVNSNGAGRGKVNEVLVTASRKAA